MLLAKNVNSYTVIAILSESRTKNPENPKVEETTKKQETPIQSPSQSTESDNNFDSELIKAFIGKNHHKFSKKFNIAAFFFNTSYLIYRKMYLLGIIGIIAFNILFYFLPSTNSNQTLTTLGVMLIALLSFNIIIGFTTFPKSRAWRTASSLRCRRAV